MATRLRQELVGQQVRRLRRRAGLSLRALAAQSGFSPSFISQLENGQVSPSITSMERIGAILGVGLADLFAEAKAGQGALIVRVPDRPQADSLWSQAQIQSLATSGVEHELSPLLVTMAPGGRSGKHPTPPGREEFMYVLEGELLVTVGPDEVAVGAGDALIVRPREVRRYQNPGPGPARILIVSAPKDRRVPPAEGGRRPRRRLPASRRGKGR
jgi:transcriptional regulator with XRE-family HTH domain